MEPDVEGAKQVLANAGYTLQGDKLIDPDGEPVTFELRQPAGCGPTTSPTCKKSWPMA